MIRLAFILSAAASVVPWSAAAEAQTRTAETVLMSENPGGRAFQEKYGYSDAVIAGDTVYLSGIVVGQMDGEPLEASYERAYGHIGGILKRAGAGWEDVVDVTSFHTDVNAQLDAMSAVHKRHLAAPYPAWTAIDIDRLIPERGITEIKIVARRPKPASAD